MRNTATVRTTPHHSRRASCRAAVIVVASAALTITTLGVAAPASAAPAGAGAADASGPGTHPAYATSTIPVAGTPDRVAVDESTHTAYVTNPKSAPQGTNPPNSTVSVIDLSTKLVTHTVEVGIYPTSIAVDASTHRVYVANGGAPAIIGPRIGTTVSVIDTVTYAVTTSAAVPGTPQAVAIDPDTHRVYVTHSADSSDTVDGVSALDPNSLAFTDTIRVDAAPQQIAIAAGRAYVPVTNEGRVSSFDSLAAINLATKEVTYIPVGRVPLGVAVDPITHRAYVTQGTRNPDGAYVDFGVAIVDTTTNTYLATIPVGGAYPILVEVDSAAHTAYATNSAGTVAVIDTTTSQLAGTVTVGGHATGVAVDKGTHRAYVANGLGLVVLERNGDTATTTPSVGAINPIVSTNGFSLLFATVASGTAGGSVVFSDGGAVIGRCSSRPIIFGYALCFTNFTTGGDHVITANYVGDDTHAPSSVSVPVAVTAQPDPLQEYVSQVIGVGYIILGLLVPEENLNFFF